MAEEFKAQNLTQKYMGRWMSKLEHYLKLNIEEKKIVELQRIRTLQLVFYAAFRPLSTINFQTGVK